MQQGNSKGDPGQDSHRTRYDRSAHDKRMQHAERVPCCTLHQQLHCCRLLRADACYSLDMHCMLETQRTCATLHEHIHGI